MACEAICSVNLNVAVQVPTMLHILDDQLTHQLQEKKSTILLWMTGQVKVWELTDIVKMQRECVRNILYEYLQMKKLCARRVPRLVIKRKNKQHIDHSERNLTTFQRDPNTFFRRFATLDKHESVITHYPIVGHLSGYNWMKSDQSDQRCYN